MPIWSSLSNKFFRRFGRLHRTLFRPSSVSLVKFLKVINPTIQATVLLHEFITNQPDFFNDQISLHILTPQRHRHQTLLQSSHLRHQRKEVVQQAAEFGDESGSVGSVDDSVVIAE